MPTIRVSHFLRLWLRTPWVPFKQQNPSTPTMPTSNFLLGPVYWHWVRLRRLSHFKHARDLTFSDSGPAMSSMTSSSDLSMKISLRCLLFRPGEINGGHERGGLPGDVFSGIMCTLSSRVTIFGSRVAEQIAAGLDESGRLSSLNASGLIGWEQKHAPKLGLTRWANIKWLRRC